MKHHISYFYNALLEYYPLHQAWCETKFVKYRENKLKVCSKCSPLAWTQARRCVGHWLTASSVGNFQASPHVQ